MFKKNNIMTNYFFNSFYYLFTVIMPLIVTPYLVRKLLPVGIGINSYVNSIMIIFTTFGLLGLNLYSTREVAYVRKSKKDLSKTFYELFILRIIFLIITGIILMIYSSFSKYEIYFHIHLLTLIYTFLDITWLYQGLEEFKSLFIRNIIIKTLTLICIFIFIKDSSDLNILMYIYGIFGLIGSLSLYPLLKKILCKCTIRNLNIKKHFIPNLKLFLPQASSLIYLQFDKVLIESITNNISLVGFYTKSEQLIKIPLALITSLATVLLPKMSFLYKNNNMNDIKKYFHLAVRFSLMFSIPLMFGILAISKSMIPWFLGEKFLMSKNILMCLSPIIVIISLSSITGNQYLISINDTKTLTKSYVIGAFINIVLDYILISKIGVYGAVIGTIITELSVFTIQYCSIKNIITFREIFKYSYKYFFFGIIVFIVCHSFNLFMKENIITTLIQIIVGISTYVILLIISKDLMFKNYSKRILKYFTKGDI